MLHALVHVRRDVALTAGAADEELDQVEQRCVAVLLVQLNPVIHQRLPTTTAPDVNAAAPPRDGRQFFFLAYVPNMFLI